MESKFKLAKIFSFALIGAVIMYGAIAFYMAERNAYGGSSEAKMNFLRLIVFGVSAMQIMMALTLRKIFFSAQGAARTPEKLLTGHIVTNAICEAAAVIGLVLFFITKSFWDFGICGAVALMGLLYLFPREKDWNKPAV